MIIPTKLTTSPISSGAKNEMSAIACKIGFTPLNLNAIESLVDIFNHDWITYNPT